MPYVSEWKTERWTKEELSAAFEGKLEGEPLQYDWTTPVFEPKVPRRVTEAVAGGYGIETQPKAFGLEKYNWSMRGMGRIMAFIGLGALAVLGLILWALVALARWIFGI